MVPPVVYLIPQFVNISDLPLIHVSLINNWAGVWLPEAASALNILILKSFFDTIPTDLTDAARLFLDRYFFQWSSLFTSAVLNAPWRGTNVPVISWRSTSSSSR